MSDRRIEQSLFELLQVFELTPDHAARECLKRLASASTRITVGRDALLLPGHYLLIDGWLGREIAGTDGNYHITLLFEPGDYLSIQEIPTEDGERYRMLAPGYVLAVEAESWRAALSECAPLALAFSRNVSAQLDRCATRIAGLMGESVRTRLARYLLRVREEHSNATRPLRQYDIARYFGVQPETVNRTLRSFVELGLLERDKERIVIRDLGRLKRMAANRSAI